MELQASSEGPGWLFPIIDASMRLRQTTCVQGSNKPKTHVAKYGLITLPVNTCTLPLPLTHTHPPHLTQEPRVGCLSAMCSSCTIQSIRAGGSWAGQHPHSHYRGAVILPDPFSLLFYSRIKGIIIRTSSKPSPRKEDRSGNHPDKHDRR